MRFQPNRDLRHVVRLLELGFEDELDERDRRWLKDLSDAGPLLGWLARAVPGNEGVFTGFVWYDEGRLVGNVSLIRRPAEAWTVANVVTHPTARRRGIARHLMLAAIRSARSREIAELQLHVRRGNLPAQALYRALGFRFAGAATTFWLDDVRVARPPHEAVAGVSITAWRRSHDSRARRLVARAGVGRGRAPGAAIRSATEQSELRQRLDDWLHSRRRVALAASSGSKFHALALALLAEHGSGPHQLAMLIDPAWRGRVERPLLAAVIRRMANAPSGRLEVEIPAREATLDIALREAGFHERRTLEQYVLDIDATTPESPL